LRSIAIPPACSELAHKIRERGAFARGAHALACSETAHEIRKKAAFAREAHALAQYCSLKDKRRRQPSWGADCQSAYALAEQTGLTKPDGEHAPVSFAHATVASPEQTSCLRPDSYALSEQYCAFACFGLAILMFVATTEANAQTATHSVASSQTPSTVASTRATETPDLLQSSPEAALPWGGMAHCGPVAASNSLIWFANNGFDRLVKGDPAKSETQNKLALQLGNFMHTSYTAGTTVSAFLRGMEDYLQDTGHTGTLKYQGWEEHPARFSAGPKPALSFIREGLKNDSATWIKIGWYRYFPLTKTYVRFAGHWVTLVGANSPTGTPPEPATLLIHDPAPRSGKQFTSERVTVSNLSTGKLATGYEKHSRSAAGMLQLGGQLKIKDKADCGLVDGIVVLTNLKSL
jgi:hypothetical protein